MKKITANDFYDELKRGTYFPYRVQAAIIEIEQKLSEKVQALRHNNEQESKAYERLGFSPAEFVPFSNIYK